MPKSKKSSNKKPIVVFIYGPIATGKLTVAKILSEKLGYKLSHNHHIADFVQEIFDFGTYESHALKLDMRYMVPEHLARAGENFVMTYAYSHNFVYKTGLKDPKFVENLEKKLTKLGAKFYSIHLFAKKEELLNRVNKKSREEFKKLTDKKIMKEWIENNDLISSPKLKNHIFVDNTNLSPKKVADIIIKHFKLKIK